MKILLKTVTTTIIIFVFFAQAHAVETPPAAVPPATQKPATAPVAAPALSKEAKEPKLTAPAAKDAKPASAAAAKDEKPAAAPVSVQERFRTHTGPRTPAALSELFNAPASAGFRQQPEVVLTNGAEMASIVVVIPAKGAAAPSFSFNDASLMSSAQIGKDQWLIEVLPETGVMKAEMIVLSNGSTLVVPLSVAPPLPADTDLSEKGFIAFLGTAGKDAPARPLQDLNGDGRRDYLDDYIYTANYLVNKRSPVSAAPAAAGESRATQTPNPIDPDAAQRFLDSQAKSAAEQKAAAEGQGAAQTFGGGGGWVSGTGAATNTGGTSTTTGGYTTTTGGTTTSTNTTNPNTTTGGTTGGTTTPTGGMTTITSPTGRSVTYIGTDKNNLNLRNLKAKEQADLLSK